MRKKTILGFGLAALAVAAFAIVQTAHANARNLFVSWQTDPARHVCPNYLQARSNSTAGDCTLRLNITEAATGALIREAAASNDPATPFDSLDDPLVVKVGVMSYPSGTVFLVRADYLDATGALAYTQTQNFTKP